MIATNENNFPHNLLWDDRQVTSLHKALANNSSKDVKLWKVQLSKIIQLVGFLGWILALLMKHDGPLMNNILMTLAKSVLVVLRLTAASGANAGIHKMLFGSRAATLMISSKEMEDIVEIIQSLKDFCILIS